jgi:hypothetical protein
VSDYGPLCIECQCPFMGLGFRCPDCLTLTDDERALREKAAKPWPGSAEQAAEDLRRAMTEEARSTSGGSRIVKAFRERWGETLAENADAARWELAKGGRST